MNPKQEIAAKFFDGKSSEGINSKNIYSSLNKSAKQLEDIYSLKHELLTGRIHYDAKPLFVQPKAIEVLEHRVKLGQLPPNNREMNLAMIEEELVSPRLCHANERGYETETNNAPPTGASSHGAPAASNTGATTTDEIEVTLGAHLDDPPLCGSRQSGGRLCM